MEKNIMIVALVLSIAFMLVFADKGFLQSAYAQFEFTDLAVANSPNFVYAISSGVNYLAIGRTAVNNEAISVYNIDTGALINTISLISAVGNGVFQDMYCIGIQCFALHGSSAGTDSSDVSGYNIATGTTIGNYNFTAPYTETAGGALVATGDIETTLFVFVTDGGDTYYEVINTTTNPFTLVNRIDVNTGNNGVEDAEVQTVSSVNYLAFITDAVGSQFQLWNRGTSAIVCSAGIGTGTEDIIAFNSIWYISDSEEIEIYNNSCVDTGTIANTQLCNAGGTEPVRAISASSFRNEVYANCDENVASPRIVVVNATSNLKLSELVLAGNAGTNHDGIVYHRESDTLISVMTSTSQVRIFFFGSPTEEGGGTATNGQCPVGSTALTCLGEGTSPFAGITGGQNATDVSRALTDGLGLTNCGEDGDPETCGSGLFLFLFLLIITEFLSLAGYLGFARKQSAEIHLVDIALMILIIGFVDLAIGFYLNWIPDIVFYSIVVVVAGFLTFGLISKIKGSG